MKKISVILFMSVLLAGCGNTTQSDKVVVDFDMVKEYTETQLSSYDETTVEQISDAVIENVVSGQADDQAANEEKSTENVVSGQADDQTANEEQNTEQDINVEQVDSNSDFVENDNYYSACTAYSKVEVETFAATVKSLILNKNWEQLADMVFYPITIGNTTYNSKEDFVNEDFSSVFGDAFYTGINNETCTDMFCNYNGIMLGEEGEVWIAEVIGSADGQGELKVIGINP
jgi:PBP1b-binding outer membrane lipoprotein LpoB